MKRIWISGILSLAMSFSATAQVNPLVPNTPFVVQPASSFQPFQANAPFYINSPYQTNPAYVPNPPYNPTPNYSSPQPRAPLPEISVPEARPLEAPNPRFNAEPEAQVPIAAQSDRDLAQSVRQKPSVAPVPPSAVLALRSGRQIEVQSHVIAGDILVIATGNDSRRMKLADLDIDKTRRLNQVRGIQFVLPQR
jgi:hypothetical protein